MPQSEEIIGDGNKKPQQSFKPASLFAITTFLTAGLFFLGPVLPPMGFMIALLSPAPVAYLAYKTSWREAAFAILSAAISAGAVLGWANGLEYVLTFGLGGLLVGLGIKGNWKPQKIVALFALPSVLGFVGFVLIGAHKAGLGPMEYIASLAGEWSEPLKKALTAEDMSPEMALEVKTTLEGTQKFIRELAFGISAGFSLLLGAFNASFMRRLLKDRGEPIEDWSGWKAPEAWVWVLIIAGAMTALGDATIAIIGKNVLIPMVVIYFLQGLVIGQHVLQIYNVSKFFKAIIYALVILNVQFALPFLSLMGAFDQWIDVRGRLKPKPAEQ